MLHARAIHLCYLAAIGAALLCGCAASSREQAGLLSESSTGSSISPETLSADLPAARVRFDLYFPTGNARGPLVVVAHGWLRNRTNMAGWGLRLAEEGFVVAIPDLPAFADHPFNGKAMNELIGWLCTDARASSRIDPQRIGVVGFSTGGLATLLAAADNPNIRIWVGLDPVERYGRGTAAASRYDRKAVIVRAPPSSWNHHGNIISIIQALPSGCVDIVVPDAIHIDPEWPTEWQMEMLMGKTSEARRQLFVQHAVDALKGELR